MKAKFRCLKCDYIWEDNPGPTTCKKCGYCFIQWLNYDEMERLIFREERKGEIK